MKVIETPLRGLLIVEPGVFNDERGYFFESYQQKRYIEAGIEAEFIQDNESKSTKGVIRGLHYQLNPYAQAKLVRVVQGAVYDVALDLRKGSPTFGRYFGIELSAENKLQLFIPRGFAHGFSVLTDTAIFSYKCDNIYHKESERSVNINDPKLKIDWKIEPQFQIVSEKDKVAPLLEGAETNFVYQDK
ncbi:MAG: dTDP-4-dehydrorhamnose 3,5-epimerase [Draconibacterium sp.]